MPIAALYPKIFAFSSSKRPLAVLRLAQPAGQDAAWPGTSVGTSAAIYAIPVGNSIAGSRRGRVRSSNMKRLTLLLLSTLLAGPTAALAGFSGDGFGSPGFFQQGVPSSVAISCTGGTHTVDGSGNTVITFTASGSLVCSGSFTAEILVVGGGGGAAASGGGAGGYCTTEGTPTCGLGSTVTIPTGTTTVTVGAGGAGTSGGATGSPGANSSLGSLVTALGGGGGGPVNANAPVGSNGGSGGGAGASGSSSTNTGGTGSQGNNGGTTPGSFPFPFCASGGGGAGAVGGNATAAVCGNGGNGLANSITGSSVPYAGGGGASSAATGSVTVGTGGTGGGGNAAFGGLATPGAPNTGGGGGGTDQSDTGAAGGSGIVIISCATSVCGL
jgi:mucin-19